jgi:DnaJ homolog subfamily C member 19
MLMLALGLGMLALLMFAARSFSRASVDSIKALLAWIAALAGLSLAVMLFLTGRGAAAISGLVLLGPLAWSWWKEAAVRGPAPGPVRPAGPMTRAEALEVLGLKDPVSESDVRAAWVRLMRVSHPDGGGSDWLAARVNQAKDVLLGRR